MRLLCFDVVEFDVPVEPNLSFTLAVESDQFFLGVERAKLTFD